MKPAVKKWKKALIRQRLLVVSLLLVQLFSLLFFITRYSRIFGHMHIILSVLSIVAALYVIAKEGEPTAKLSWVFLILLVPIFGGFLYLFYAFQYGQKKLKRQLAHMEKTFMPLFYAELSVLPVLEQQGHENLPLMRYLQEQCSFPVYANTACTYLSPGERFYELLLSELKKAKKYIIIETFIIEEGRMWDGILQILCEKVKQGVEVRLMYDDVGCFLTLPRDYCETLQGYGIKAKVFNPFRPILSAMQNQRDHRKIISIDGKVAFTGGSNLADEYINAYQKHGHWHDSMVCLRGEAAWCLTLISLQLQDIYAESKDIAALCPWQDAPNTVETDGYVQAYADNPLRSERIGASIYLHAIQRAKEYVYINTPYLVVDDTMLRALKLAAKSGVDVRIVVPNTPDHPMVHRTTRSFYPQLIKAGVKIYEYAPGFMHSKICLTDDKLAVVGTSNFDYRSLYQHFECGVVLYGCSALAQIKSRYIDTLEQCRRVSKEECEHGIWLRMEQLVLRLFAPMM